MFWNNIRQSNSNPIQLNDQFKWKISVFEKDYFIDPEKYLTAYILHKIIVPICWIRTNMCSQREPTLPIVQDAILVIQSFRILPIMVTFIPKHQIRIHEFLIFNQHVLERILKH